MFLFVEDIIDTGQTLKNLRDIAESSSVKINDVGQTEDARC